MVDRVLNVPLIGHSKITSLRKGRQVNKKKCQKMTQGAPKKNDVAQNFSGAIFFCNSIFAPSYLSDRHSEQQLKKHSKEVIYVFIFMSTTFKAL